jgi:hypothetical protein
MMVKTGVLTNRGIKQTSDNGFLPPDNLRSMKTTKALNLIVQTLFAMSITHMPVRTAKSAELSHEKLALFIMED